MSASTLEWEITCKESHVLLLVKQFIQDWPLALEFLHGDGVLQNPL